MKIKIINFDILFYFFLKFISTSLLKRLELENLLKSKIAKIGFVLNITGHY